jgi:two-component system chemotaxis sensor kinase CheA
MAHSDKVFGLMVEKLIGQEEVVIKSMGGYLANTKGVSGATITGDGRVVLIIDIMGLYTSL